VHQQLQWASINWATFHFRLPVVRQVFKRVLTLSQADSDALVVDRSLEDLVRVLIPGRLQLDIREIVALRRNSDAFMAWRTQLRSALTDLETCH
jgi:hypothetical protein